MQSDNGRFDHSHPSRCLRANFIAPVDLSSKWNRNGALSAFFHSFVPRPHPEEVTSSLLRVTVSTVAALAVLRDGAC